MGAVVIILSYLLGSISFSILVAKKIAKIDIRQHGSGNAGATNTLRVLGKGPGIAVLLLDAAKGAIAVGIAYWLSRGEDWVVVFSGVAAIIGHNWPIFFGFRGGKGVATTIGTLIALTPLPALIAVIITIAVIAITRYVSLGSLVFFTLIPIILIVNGASLTYIIGTLAIAALGYIRHIDNIKRLIRGTERKLGQSKR
ncbi:glycerol-3-phosphate 1-O-acyltransferase PlsY [Aneurinibacillus aneurinilyticus]|jgi:glycerol-3-phosphate acyltransferase PlsY|uniref:Glycerol-3-phosphate acyltransferase n=2 Tax=Aneurinibacillus aneurinilyticus TaxID=1391 RepID=A0A848CM07_ANEAE|nr:glycerol-3-phosphate 1-O-acyltransferase PlsY [Aneurinibacillus aneurinilyticus]ERI10108.1 acyl-phosphate glycerol 3-phosphate acyltransferase [Aneurinibacillus aneurinilyticus ATCC 12856]MCI1692987.1 glycerol-3-phosphate 1-O-acyltransferase PlsY [Aneurinibacillus aneurinilyticus]MED0669881.1 glycerol-3-phosphate 1-O-acyltransferase PlsY [Aneurinibacillus aneurinilyticus]MED0708050.1 glycerol-3-phosphate 1-O-acyltransferase PlsY [Aneurinibacillus aneurinilyticus]MED0726076.1 glycerol-3-phos